jgi:hypothetical protein
MKMGAVTPCSRVGFGYVQGSCPCPTVATADENRPPNVTVGNLRAMQRQSELEYQMLSKIGAMETIRSHFHSLAAWSSEESRERADSGLVTHITTGSIPQPAPPTPRFAALQNRLAAAGIAATLVDGQLRFRLQPPSGEAIELAQPVRHPWLGEHGLTRVGAPEVGVDNLFPYTVPIRRRERQLPNASKTLHLPEFEAVVRANEKLSQLMAN